MDVFISHASEDKAQLAIPLAENLKKAGLRVWLDKEQIRSGDSIPEKVNQGLAGVRIGIVIASPIYFEKAWTQEELRTLLELELAGKIERIIPIWHHADKQLILQRFPSLAHRLAIQSGIGVEQIALEILKAIDPQTYQEQHPIFLEFQKNAVCRFLAEIENEYKYVPIFHPPHKIILQDQYIPIEVTLERRYRHEVETTWGYAEGEAELARAYALKGMHEEVRREQVPWQEAKQKHKRMMVLADPGMGKTSLLKMEAVTTAQEEREKLEKGERNIDDVVLPVFLKLVDLAKNQNDEMTAAIQKAIYPPYPQDIAGLLRQKLKTGKCLLLLDALDEVPRDQWLDLQKRLDTFACHFSCPIICTSRIVGYGGAFLHDAKEVEIVPFRQKQIEQYIETWFKNLEASLKDSRSFENSGSLPDAEGLIQELCQKPQIRGLAQNPLLLSLLCSLYQEQELTLPARRVEIYKQAVEYMLKEWTRNRKPQSEGRIRAKLRLLEELAYRFSCEYQEIFAADDLYDRIEAYLHSETSSSVFKQSDSDTLITELTEEDGVIQKLEQEGDRYLFLHRTFQEYLTAAYLNRQPNGIELAKTHFWDFDWHETLILFAGLAGDPTLLLNTLLAERDDIFHTLLLLAGNCLAECPQLKMPQLVEQLYDLWQDDLYCEFTEPTVVAVGQTHQQMLTYLLTALQGADWHVRGQAMKVLGEIGDMRAVAGLLSMLHDTAWDVKRQAVEALGELDDVWALEPLLAALHDTDEDVRRAAAEALERIGDARAIEPLLATLHDPVWRVRRAAARALREIGSSVRGMEGLLAALHDPDRFVRRQATKVLWEFGGAGAMASLLAALHDTAWDVKRQAVEALEEFDDMRAVDGLLAELHDANWGVRHVAAEALGQIGDVRAVDDLLAALHDVNEIVRRKAAEALGKLGDARAVEGLLAALHDVDGCVRSEAAEALGNIGDVRGMEGLLAALHDAKKDVRGQAAWALGELGDARAVDSLVAALHDPVWGVRSHAAEALGKIGDARAVDSLVAALHDLEKWVRGQAAEALGELGDTRTVVGLLAALHDPDSDVRWYTAEALGKIGTLNVLQKLLHRLDIDIYDKEIFSIVRQLAITSSRLLPPPACLPIYPQPLFLRRLKERVWRVRILWSSLLNKLRQKMR
jgi:HEAT repeat protein